jgi:HEAT repeat protein
MLQGDPDAESVLQALAEHTDRDVRRLAVYGLKTIEESRKANEGP